MSKRSLSVFPALAAAVMLLLAVAPQARAQVESAVSRWSQGSKSAIRLVAGGAGKDGSLRAGLEVKLAPGFKTYWRSPGDSGVPPRFDWSASENVAGLAVNWPAPLRFGEGPDSAIGYIADVILPLSVRPAIPAKPVKLILRLDYAVCEKICIPASGEAELILASEPTPESERIAAFKARVPVPLARNGPDDLPRVLEALVVHGANGDTTVQIVTNWSGTPQAGDVFVEGPDNWSFGKPDYRLLQDNRLVAMVPITDKPKSAGGSVPLIVTLTDGAKATETRLDLDMTPARP